MSKTINKNELIILGTEQAKVFVKTFLENPETWGFTFYENRLASEFEYDLKLVSDERCDYYCATNKVGDYQNCVMLLSIVDGTHDDFGLYIYVTDSTINETNL